MSTIKYMLKPDTISWDDVQECQRKAHVINNKKNLHMTCQDMTGNELREMIGDGFCFVAVDGDKVVGTTSVKLLEQHRWWNKGGKVAYYCHSAVLPEYRGTDVYIDMTKLMTDFVKDSGVKIHQFNTAVQNKSVIRMNERNGYKRVQFSATGKGANYYSIVMCKWDEGCPYSDRFINFMFVLSKIIVKAIWRPGYKFRFWFN